MDVVRLHVPRNICFPTSEQIDAKRFIALSKAALKRTIRPAFFDPARLLTLLTM